MVATINTINPESVNLVKRILLLILGFSFGAVLVQAASLEYSVTIKPGKPTAHIVATVQRARGTSIKLVLKNEASYVEKYILNIKSKNKVLRRIGEGKWSARATNGALTYEYDIANIVPWHPNVPWGTSNDIAVYINSQCALIMAPYFFVYPDHQEFTSIRLRFHVPAEWKIVTPYITEGDFYVVQQVSSSLLYDFINRQQIYMGQMQFYAEKNVDGCIVKFGKLFADDEQEILTQNDVNKYVDATARTLQSLTALFGSNPYTVFAMYTNFRHGSGNRQFTYQGTRYLGNGYQYWPEHRWDELVGHAMLAWVGGGEGTPLRAKLPIVKGIFEDYYGHTMAWQLFGDRSYLAKIYHYFLMYEWMYDHHSRGANSYTTHGDEYDWYFRWEFIGLLLDRQIQNRSKGAHNLADAINWLYRKYANSGHVVTPFDLEQAIGLATGVWLNDIFTKYVYKDMRLPVDEYLAKYKSAFQDYIDIFQQAFYRDDYCGHIVPFFIDIVLAASCSKHLPWGIGGERHAPEFAKYVLEHYQLDQLTNKDVTDALSKLTGEDCSDFFTHWEDSYGRLTLESIVGWLKDYKNGSVEQSSIKGASARSEEAKPIGEVTAGVISWSGTLKTGEEKQITVTVYNEKYIDAFSNSIITIKLDKSSDWGNVIQDGAMKDKEKFSVKYGNIVRYFEETRIHMTQQGDRWIGKVTIVPTVSLVEILVSAPIDSADRPFFGKLVSVLAQ